MAGRASKAGKGAGKAKVKPISPMDVFMPEMQRKERLQKTMVQNKKKK